MFCSLKMQMHSYLPLTLDSVRGDKKHNQSMPERQTDAASSERAFDKNATEKETDTELSS